MRQTLIAAAFAGLMASTQAAKPTHTLDAKVKRFEPKRKAYLTSTLGHKVVQSANMTNYSDMMISAEFHIGSQKESHELILDTGSFWTWIESPECTNCPTLNTFDPASSKTWKYDQAHLREPLLQGYGSGLI
jgi:hypothetical protein